MEDTVVRYVWHTSTAAVVLVFALVGETALGAPPTNWWGGNTSAPPTSPILAQNAAMAQPVTPSSQIEPLDHPVQYFMAAMSELPIASSFRGSSGSSNVTAAPVTSESDPLSLQAPVGPPTPQLFVSLAQMAERQGNVEQARHQYKQALAQWPNDVNVLRSAARMEDRAGHLDWAEYLYQRAATADPHNAGTLNDLGLCLARQGKLDQAVQTIEQAVHIQPDKALYRNNVATVLVEQRQDQKALAHLAAVHAPAEASYNMGQLLIQRNREDEAEPYFVAALQQDPELKPAELALARLHGEPVVDHSAVVRESETPSTPIAVEEGPTFAPQPSYQPTVQSPVAPTPTYPAYVPANYPQQTPATTYNVPAGTPVGVVPRYLPPVGATPGSTDTR